MEKQPAESAPKNLYDTMIEKLKAAAFPVLVAVVIWMGKDMLTEIKSVGDQITSVLLQMRSMEVIQEQQDKRLQKVETNMDKLLMQ